MKVIQDSDIKEFGSLEINAFQRCPLKITTASGTHNVDKFGRIGNTDWLTFKLGEPSTQVTTNDTGWRILTNPARISKGGVVFRRVDDMCFVGLSGGYYDTVELNQTGMNYWKSNIIQIPTGFRSSTPILTNLYDDGADVIGTFFLTSMGDGNWVQLKKVAVGARLTLVRSSLLVYPTTDPWPTTLPGEPFKSFANSQIPAEARQKILDEDKAKSQAHSAAWAEWKRNNPT